MTPTPAIPIAVYTLALAIFAQGTSEFMLAGLLPSIAADADVSVGQAGLLTSTFAVGMVVGAPVMAILARDWPRRRALVLFLSVFVAVHVVGGVTSSFPVLLGTRIIGALANAGFMAVALAVATTMVAPDAKGRTLGILLAGTTLACVIGVPGGALLGELFGWRAAFWAVALISLPAIVAVFRFVPGHRDEDDDGAPSRGSVTEELAILRRPAVVVTLSLGALINGATFCSFTFLAPLVTDVTGLDTGWVPIVLALFGVGSFVGVRIGGRAADANPIPLQLVGGAGLLAGWLALALLADGVLPTLVLIPALGVLSFAVGSTLIARVLYVAADARILSGALATASLNVGAAIGPWLGGLAIEGDRGTTAPLLISAVLVAAAFVVAGTARLASPRRPHPSG